MESRKKKVVIIGAGIAGLSAGTHCVSNDLDAEIIEMHDIPGGQCTSWKKGKFTFDGCLHWLIGSKPGGYMNHLWTELGALEGTEIIDHDRYTVLHFPDGKTLNLYVDPDKLEKELISFSPEDEKEIRNLAKTIRGISRIKMVSPDAQLRDKTFRDLLDFLGFMGGFLKYFKWLKISARDYSQKFKNPGLGLVIRNLFLPDFAMFFNLATFAWLAQKNAGYPVGGSLKLARKIADNAERKGVRIRYGARVRKVLTEADGENHRAIGVELENGKVIPADYVISAADGRTTVDELLGGKFHNPRLKLAWDTLPVFDPLFYVSLGLKGSWDDPSSVSGSGVIFKKPFNTGGREIEAATIHSLHFDPTLAPAGKCVVEIMCSANFDFWDNLKKKDPKKYKQEKERIAGELIDLIDRDYFPGLKKRIEKIDIATPTTWVRYTGVYRGAFEGLQMTTDVLKVGMSLPKQLDGLNNFYLCGQWVEPGGGLPPAIFSGKTVAAMIAKAEGRKFRSPA